MQQQAEQKKWLKAVLTTKESKTYSQIKHERRVKEGKNEKEDDGVTPGILDGYFLLKHCCVEDPGDLCKVDVACQDLTDAREEDFELFPNVAYINAGENMLPFESFRSFESLRQLEIPLNGLRGLKVSFEDFPSLEVLDLSYNNLSKDDILALGVLPKLRVLHLSGNQLRSLPPEMQKPHLVPSSDSDSQSLMPRFSLLEILHLDDNQLSDLTTFASLAGLRRLKELNLEKNIIQAIPHLKAVSGRLVAVESAHNSTNSTPRKRRPKSGRSRSGTPDSLSNKNKEIQSDSQSQLNDIEESLLKDFSLAADSLSDDGDPESLPPPFPELTYLNLAHNEIAYEENLLAVAAWPMLTKLDIHDNPLTTRHSGPPPLLKRYLVDRLGVHMVRQRPASAPKPVIQVAHTPSRKVEEVIRPLPKRPLQLMLEPSQDKPAVLPPSEEEAPQQVMRSSSRPLPPISPSVDGRPLSDAGGGVRGRPQTDPGDGVSGEATAIPGADRPKTWGYENVSGTVMGEEKQDSNAEEPVFLTQVDDEGEREQAEVDPSSPEVPPPRREKEMRADSAKYSMSVPQKFKGYEVFWDAPEDEDVIIQKDIQSNLRSLKLAVNHKPVFRSEVDLDRLQKPFEPHQKTKFQPKPPHKTKAEKLEEVLEEIKHRVTVTEENLGKILQDKERMRKEYPEVPALLKEIQGKYKAVRAESMREQRQLVKAKEDIAKSAKEMRSSVHTPATKISS